MEVPIVQSSDGVTLLGGGSARPKELEAALRRAPSLVAVDGGARIALDEGRTPEAVIGDMDSLPPEYRAALPADRVYPITDQDSTDFDKALRSVDAPLVIGVGFLGRRIDHQLANCNVLVRRHDRTCLLLGKHDVIFSAPSTIELDLPPESRVSLFPMAPVTGTSTGLNWPIDGLEMTPQGTIGTSNHVATDHRGSVRLALDAPGMLVILPRAALDAAIEALARATPFSPAR